MQSVRFTTVLDYEAFCAFWFFSQKRNKRYRRAGKRMMWPLITIALVDVYLLMLSTQDGMVDLRRSALVLTGLWVLLALMETYKLYVLPHKAYNGYGDAILTPWEWEISEEGICCEKHDVSVDESVRFDYSNVHTVYETHDAFYIFTAKNVARVIPKKQLTEQQCSNAAAILQKGVGEEKYRLLYKK